jgi:hypothetical protein
MTLAGGKLLDTLEAREVVEFLESTWRWVILLTGLAAVGSGIAAWTGRSYERLRSRLGLIFLLAFYVGVALGLVDWVLHVLGGVNMGIFFTIIHPLAMLGALTVAHLTFVRASRTIGERDTGRVTTLGFLASLAITVVAMPGVLFRGGIFG